MTDKSVLMVFGTRPEAIKMAPVALELQRSGLIKLDICITGQHRQMIEPILKLFAIEPEFDLNIMQPGQDLTDITSNVLLGLRPLLQDRYYDLLMVHGDTSTTLAASLAAYYQRIPVGHVEAGLRTGNIYSPWPEEINRRLTGGIAALHFAPTSTAQTNLMAEGVAAEQIFITGNTVIDALLQSHGKIESDSVVQATMAIKFNFLDPDKRLILVTGHRRENFGDGFDRIVAALKTLAQRSDIEILYPVHLNPHVQSKVHSGLATISNVHLIEPQGYLDFIYLLSRAHIVLTDSGGVQEEAPSLGKPVLVMRDTTERPEAVKAGTARIVGTDIACICSEIETLLDDQSVYDTMARASNPYGDGKASERIRKIVERSDLLINT